jgi:hypothetical protein
MELTGEKILSYPPESQVILNTFLHKIVSTEQKSWPMPSKTCIHRKNLEARIYFANTVNN